jgi:hypothetical protein
MVAAATPFLPFFLIQQAGSGRVTAGPSTAERSSFHATVAGSVTAHPSGSAIYGALANPTDAARSTISLGAESSSGSILFTRNSAELPAPGEYRIVDAVGNLAGDETWAMIVLGSPTSPTGAFRATSGTLRITTAADGRLVGSFELDAVGFLAERPDDDSLAIKVTGTFDAGTVPDSEVLRTDTSRGDGPRRSSLKSSQR